MMLKIQYLIKNFSKLIIGVSGAILIIALKPVINIRIGILKTERIGHYVTETQLTILQNQTSSKNIMFDIWYENGIICNTFIQNYWRQKIRVFPKSIMAPIYTVMKFLRLPKGFFLTAVNGDRDTLDHLFYQTNQMTLTDQQINAFRQELAKIGLPLNAKFICFHNRDSEYLKEIYPNQDYSHHDCRDTTFSNYVMALEALANRGYYILRMGKVTKEKILENIHPRIIDYANSEKRSDEFDVIAIAECEYFISNSSGIDSVATFLKKPLLIVNNSTIGYLNTWNDNAFYSNKRFFDLRSHTELSLTEIINREAHEITRKLDYESKGIYLKENTPEENLEYLIEFDDYFKDKNNFMQQKSSNFSDLFWQKFPYNSELNPKGVKRCEISEVYLSKTRILQQ
jgi:putative glycosyltransferase (TIGR04372 family)